MIIININNKIFPHPVNQLAIYMYIQSLHINTIAVRFIKMRKYSPHLNKEESNNCDFLNLNICLNKEKPNLKTVSASFNSE